MPNQYTMRAQERTPEQIAKIRELRTFGYWFRKRQELVESAIMIGLPKTLIVRDMGVSMTYVRKIEGIVIRKRGNEVKTIVQLSNPHERKVLWAFTYSTAYSVNTRYGHALNSAHSTDSCTQKLRSIRAWD